MQPSGPDQYMTRVNLLRTSGSPIKGLSVLIENHRSQGGDKQWCESSTTTQWPHQPKVMGMEERSHMSMNCISMHVYTHNLAKNTKTKMQLLFLDGTQVTSDACPFWSAWNVKGSDTSHTHFAHWLWTPMRYTSWVSVHCDDKSNMPQCAISRSGELSICEREIVPETAICPRQALPYTEWQVSVEETQWTLFISPGQANTRHITVMD